MKRLNIPFAAAAALLLMLCMASSAHAYPSFFDSSCAGCHSDDTVTCAGCHFHGAHSNKDASNINVTGTTDKSSYSPGETVQVTVDGGWQSGWVRAILYDENGSETARSSGPGGSGSGDSFPIVLSAPAPAAPGSYQWSVSWYGNQYDKGGAIFGSWFADTSNPGHGEEIVATNSFEVSQDLVCTDLDFDGFSVEGGECGPADCDDGNPLVFPDAVEDCTDGVDNDCDGLVDSQDSDAVGCPALCTDLDFDGFSVEGGECGPADCDDGDPVVNPSALEDCGDGIDNNCNGLVDAADPGAVGCGPECTDNDQDGFAAEGGECGPADCDDEDPLTSPGGIEICDGVDNNCDGAVDEGFDSDGDGVSVCEGDCDDSNPLNFPGNDEVCDGQDNDCDLLVDDADPGSVPCAVQCTDNDQDGFAVEGGECGPADCDDGSALVNPSAAEDCSDGVDNDCDGLVDTMDPDAAGCQEGCTDGDGDMYNADGTAGCGPADCDDGDSLVNPGAGENCIDGIDNDCNGLIDSADPVCSIELTDFDITKFKAKRSAKVGKELKIKLHVQNNGPSSTTATLNVYGMQGSTMIPIATDLQIMDGVRKGKAKLTFTYYPDTPGDIVWYAEIDDGNPDVDEKTFTSRVKDRGGNGKEKKIKKRSVRDWDDEEED